MPNTPKSGDGYLTVTLSVSAQNTYSHCLVTPHTGANGWATAELMTDTFTKTSFQAHQYAYSTNAADHNYHYLAIGY